MRTRRPALSPTRATFCALYVAALTVTGIGAGTASAAPQAEDTYVVTLTSGSPAAAIAAQAIQRLGGEADRVDTAR